MVNANIRTDNLFIGPGVGGDAATWSIQDGRIVPIPGNNPELRRLIAATLAVNPVDVAGEAAQLGDLGKIAQATLLDAGARLGATLR